MNRRINMYKKWDGLVKKLTEREMIVLDVARHPVRRVEIDKALRTRGYSGFQYCASLLEKLLCIGVLDRRKGRYITTELGRTGLATGCVLVQLNEKWLKYFEKKTW